MFGNVIQFQFIFKPKGPYLCQVTNRHRWLTTKHGRQIIHVMTNNKRVTLNSSGYCTQPLRNFNTWKYILHTIYDKWFEYRWFVMIRVKKSNDKLIISCIVDHRTPLKTLVCLRHYILCTEFNIVQRLMHLKVGAKCMKLITTDIL